MYAGQGRTYPVGNDPTVKNNGKFCGLYYETNNVGECVVLIGAEEANADFRATGILDAKDGDIGSYTPCICFENGTEYKKEVTFQIAPKQGYWFALMKYIDLDGIKQPYDKEYSGDHFAIVAFPAEYGVTGENTYIINEEGTVYQLDRGEGGYLDTYPGICPVDHGWVIAE